MSHQPYQQGCGDELSALESRGVYGLPNMREEPPKTRRAVFFGLFAVLSAAAVCIFLYSTSRGSDMRLSQSASQSGHANQVSTLLRTEGNADGILAGYLYCAPYSVSDTNNAQQNYATCYFQSCGTVTVEIIPICDDCPADSDTFIRLFQDGVEVNQNDDSSVEYCDNPNLSSLEYDVPGDESDCYIFELREGCAGDLACEGAFRVEGVTTYLSQEPSSAPTSVPTTAAPTVVPTEIPTMLPTTAPTHVPTEPPTKAPTSLPTEPPTTAPTHVPTEPPTKAPTHVPTNHMPTLYPTLAPSSSPTTIAPTLAPTLAPTTLSVIYCDAFDVVDTDNAQQNYATCIFEANGTAHVHVQPVCDMFQSIDDTVLRLFEGDVEVAFGDDEDSDWSCGRGKRWVAELTYDVPGDITEAYMFELREGCFDEEQCDGQYYIEISYAAATTTGPTHMPTAAPSLDPTNRPTTAPSLDPTNTPTTAPSLDPTVTPTAAPTFDPTAAPTAAPTFDPTAAPTAAPSFDPTNTPTATPTFDPTAVPTTAPSLDPTAAPSFDPTAVPTAAPSLDPTNTPTAAPSTAAPTTFSLQFFALKALYYATDGSSWTDNDGWLTTSDLNDWFGIKASGTVVTKINLEENNLHGTIPPEICFLTDLTVLDLSKNSLQGSIPPQVSTLVNLAKLQFVGNTLTGTVPATLGDFVSLEDLQLDENSFTGTIPPEFGQLTVLDTLDMGYNSLVGSIPDEFSALTLLTKLKLSDNSLTGALPAKFYKMQSLKYFFVHNNHLTGEIHKKISKLDEMKELYFQSNSFTGTLPEEISELTNLKELIVDYNYLSGTAPDLSMLTKLTLYTYYPQYDDTAN